jgi:hypothetical protein
MIIGNLLHDADGKVRSLWIENKRLKVWVYILIGILTLFELILMYFFRCSKFYLHKLIIRI